MIETNKSYSIEEARKLLGVKKRQIYRLLDKHKISRKKKEGKTRITGVSLLKYRLHRRQKIPEGYTSIKDAADELGVPEEVILSAIERGELKAKEHFGGLILEDKSLVSWEKRVIDGGLLEIHEDDCLFAWIKVKNIRGIHMRPAKGVVKLSRQYCREGVECRIFKNKNSVAHSNNLLEILGLGAHCGDCLRIEITGDLGRNFLIDLRKLFRSFHVYEKTEVETCKVDMRALKRDLGA